MGLFSRKGSKASVQDETLSIETNGSRTSKTSHVNSPRFGNGWAHSPVSSTTTALTRTTTMTMEPETGMTKAIDPNVDPAGYLRSIHAVRERSRVVFEKAKRDELQHFNVDMDKFSETAAYVVSIIKVSSHPQKTPRTWKICDL